MKYSCEVDPFPLGLDFSNRCRICRTFHLSSQSMQSFYIRKIWSTPGISSFITFLYGIFHCPPVFVGSSLQVLCSASDLLQEYAHLCIFFYISLYSLPFAPQHIYFIFIFHLFRCHSFLPLLVAPKDCKSIQTKAHLLWV